MRAKDALTWLESMYTNYVDDFGYLPFSVQQATAAKDWLTSVVNAQNLPIKKVKINLHDNQVPESHGEWVDLATAEDVSMKAGEFKIISLGIAMQLPPGYYAKVVPRSSTAKKHGIILANSMGIIENDYCGDNDIWCFPAYAFRDTYIPKGTRVCQFCIVPQEVKIEFEPVEKLGNDNRGGLGSTGD